MMLRDVEEQVRKARPLLPDVAGLIDCSERYFEIYVSCGLVGENGTCSADCFQCSPMLHLCNNARNEVTDLYHWSPGNCNGTAWLHLVLHSEEMISDGMGWNSHKRYERYYS